jgi:hypothetical protein
VDATDQREAILAAYDGYTEAFQSAYERFASVPGAEPDPTPALPYYHAPCLFVTPAGVALYAEPEDLARHFEEVMRDMRSNRYLRTGLGTPHVTLLGSRSALLSLEIARFDLDETKYDEYGVTYTFHRDSSAWRIAVVTTHPKAAVVRAPGPGPAS